MIPPGNPDATWTTPLAAPAHRDHDGTTARKRAVTTTLGRPTMETKPLIDTNSRFAQRSIQLVLVRANGPLFYSIATASLLEALAPLYADHMRQFFRNDEVFSAWLDKEWLPRRDAV